MKVFKHFGLVTLLFSLLLSTGGVSVYKHYCGDFLASLSFYTPASECGDEDDGCGSADMDCCDDETEYYSAELQLIKSEQTKISFEQLVFKPIDLESISFDTNDDLIFEEEHLSFNTGPPIYIMNSSLTYYG